MSDNSYMFFSRETTIENNQFSRFLRLISILTLSTKVLFRNDHYYFTNIALKYLI